MCNNFPRLIPMSSLLLPPQFFPLQLPETPRSLSTKEKNFPESLRKKNLCYSSFFGPFSFYFELHGPDIHSSFNFPDDAGFPSSSDCNLLYYFLKTVFIQTPMTRCSTDIYWNFNSWPCFCYLRLSFSQQPTFRCNNAYSFSSIRRKSLHSRVKIFILDLNTPNISSRTIRSCRIRNVYSYFTCSKLDFL